MFTFRGIDLILRGYVGYDFHDISMYGNFLWLFKFYCSKSIGNVEQMI